MWSRIWDLILKMLKSVVQWPHHPFNIGLKALGKWCASQLMWVSHIVDGRSMSVHGIVHVCYLQSGPTRVTTWTGLHSVIESQYVMSCSNCPFNYTCQCELLQSYFLHLNKESFLLENEFNQHHVWFIRVFLPLAIICLMDRLAVLHKME